MRMLIWFLWVLLADGVFAQHKLKRYEFPDFGISIPFFEAATIIYGDDKRQKNYRYKHEDKSEGSRMLSQMIMVSVVGCLPVDTVYNEFTRFASTYDNYKFRALTSIAHTLHMGWTYYMARLTIDGTQHNAMRMVQGFYNGSQMLVVDMITVDGNKLMLDLAHEIFNEPGYRSILRPLELPRLGLRLRVRGHVRAAFDEKQNLYFIGRCDKLGLQYPQVTLEMLQGPQELELLTELTEMRKQAGFEQVKFETRPNEGKLSQFTGDINNVISVFHGSPCGRTASYLFTFEGKVFKTRVIVSFMPDDNRLMLDHDPLKMISEETAKDSDKRMLEFLDN